MSTVDEVLIVAQREINTPESKAGRYRAAIDAPPDAPWCVPFVAYCLQEGLGYLPIYVPTYCSADLRCWGRRRGLVRTEPERGDVFLHTSKEGQRSNTCWHVGLVETVLEGDWWQGIEGNGTVRAGETSRVQRCRHRTPYYRTLFLRWNRE